MSINRFTFKEKLIILAKERNYSKNQIIGLIRFIDLLMTLPKDLEKKINRVIKNKFLPMKTKKIYKDDDGHLSNLIHEHLYGETIDERFSRAAKEFLKMGLPPEKIAKALKIPLEVVLGLDSKEEGSLALLLFLSDFVSKNTPKAKRPTPNKPRTQGQKLREVIALGIAITNYGGPVIWMKFIGLFICKIIQTSFLQGRRLVHSLFQAFEISGH